jgi:hypothetical protein
MTKDELLEFAKESIWNSVEKEGYEIVERSDDLLIALGERHEPVFIFLAVAMAPIKPTKEDIPDLFLRIEGHKKRKEKCFFASVSLMGPSVEGMPIRNGGFYIRYLGLEEI